MFIKKMVHVKCRSNYYPFGGIKRLVFPDSLVPWKVAFTEYNPDEYNSPALNNKPWADPDIEDPRFEPKWNDVDRGVNRVSFLGVYTLSDDRPVNPKGRTGLKGRGVLGRWGPNHAADPVVTRWRRNADGRNQMDPSTNLPILQFCAIQRKDSDEWALPGGMVDPGEQVTATLRREFLEEALNSLESSSGQLQKDKEMIDVFFTTGSELYKGYVDDPRNTDNAWMETIAVNFHDEEGTLVGKFAFQAGDDAKDVKWMDIDQSLSLYASHSYLIQTAAMLHGAHW